MEQYKKVLDEDTAIVTTMWANSETGTIFPVKEIAELAHAKGALFHTDAVQAAGKIPTDVKDINADFVSISSHKIHGPKGTGALYIKQGTRFMPFMRGGHQENLRRAGTENVPNIIGFGYAAEIALQHLPEYQTHVKLLRDLLEKELLKKIPDVKINGDIQNRLPNTLNMSFGYIEGESILMFLDEESICASSGSACTTGSLEPSHVLRAMGVPFQFAHGSIRFSLSRFTTLEEIQTVIKILPDIIARLRAISPFKKGL